MENQAEGTVPRLMGKTGISNKKPGTVTETAPLLNKSKQDEIKRIIAQSECRYKINAVSAIAFGLFSYIYCMISAQTAFSKVYTTGYAHGVTSAEQQIYQQTNITIPETPSKADLSIWFLKGLFFSGLFLFVSALLACVSGSTKWTDTQRKIAFTIASLLALGACTSSFEWYPGYYESVGNDCGFLLKSYLICSQNSTINLACQKITTVFQDDQLEGFMTQSASSTLIKNVSDSVNFIIASSGAVLANIFYRRAYEQLEIKQNAKNVLTEKNKEAISNHSIP